MVLWLVSLSQILHSFLYFLYDHIVKKVNNSSAGNNTKSKYGVKKLSPTKLKVKTKRGVKQQRRIKIVPIIRALRFFFDGLFVILLFIKTLLFNLNLLGTPALPDKSGKVY